MNIFELENVSKFYSLGKIQVRALRNVSLEIGAGEFTALAGPSGSGKSTLLNILGLIDEPTVGKLRLDGKAVVARELAGLHRLRLTRIGFIFQMFNLIPVLSAFENIEYPLLLTPMSSSQRSERVNGLLSQVGLQGYQAHKPHELSGGQRQRVAIARAMANRPAVIVADEPTANLDSRTAEEILDIKDRLNRQERTTFIFATHDPRVVERARRVITLHDGMLTADTGPSRSAPANDHCLRGAVAARAAQS